MVNDTACFLLFFFPIPFVISALLFSFPPGRNADPGSHSRLFSPPTHYGSCLAFFSREDFSSSLLFFSTFFSTFFCIMYVTQTPDNRQHTSSAGCVLQPAGYNAIHACRLPTEQEATPHASDSLSALYLLWLPSCFLLSDPAICRPAGLCCCVIHACCHRYCNTDIS